MKRTSITLEDSLYDLGLKIAAKRGFSTSFSAYVSWLMTRDADGGVTREDAIRIAPKASSKVARATKSLTKARKAVRHRTSRR